MNGSLAAIRYGHSFFQIFWQKRYLPTTCSFRGEVVVFLESQDVLPCLVWPRLTISTVIYIYCTQGINHHICLCPIHLGLPPLTGSVAMVPRTLKYSWIGLPVDAHEKLIPEKSEGLHMYDKSKTTYGKLSARRTQIYCVYFCVICFWFLFKITF